MKILIGILIGILIIVSGALCNAYIDDDNIDPSEDWGALMAVTSIIIITIIVVSLLILNLK